MTQQLLSPDKLQEKVASLASRHAKILRRKSELAGELKSKKDELASLVREIQAAGYNPRTLVEDRDKAQAELENLIVQYDSQLTDVERTLAEYDKK